MSDREAILKALTSFGHEIEDGRVTIFASLSEIADALCAAHSTPKHGEAVAWVNGDELDNMLDDRTATIQGKPSGGRRVPLYRHPPSQVDQFGRTPEMIRFQNDLDNGDDE